MNIIKKRKKTNFGKKRTLDIHGVNSILNRKNVFVYDLRPKDKFEQKKIPGSFNVSFDDIKKRILQHKKTDKIIIVGEQERSYAVIVSWARKQWYLKTYVLADGMANIKNKDLKNS